MDEYEAFLPAEERPVIPDPVALHPRSAEALRDHLSQAVPEPLEINRAERQFVSLDAARAKFGPGIPETLRPVFEQPRFDQRTPEWYVARQGAITASDFGAAAGKSKYSSPLKLYIKKTETNADAFPPYALQCMAHGVKYEDAAAYEYEQRTGNTILDFGLLSHWKLFVMRPKDITIKDWFDMVHSDTKPERLTDEEWATICDLRWLKGSPDGIAIRNDGTPILIEIKCPYRGVWSDEVRPEYMAQVQLNMEVANCDVCHFVQYQPRLDWWETPKFIMVEIKRDPKLFAELKAAARLTWDNILFFREHRRVPPALTDKITLLPDTEGKGEVRYESVRKRKRAEKTNGSPPQQGQVRVNIVPCGGEEDQWVESPKEARTSSTIVEGRTLVITPPPSPDHSPHYMIVNAADDNSEDTPTLHIQHKETFTLDFDMDAIRAKMNTVEK